MTQQSQHDSKTLLQSKNSQEQPQHTPQARTQSFNHDSWSPHAYGRQQQLDMSSVPNDSGREGLARRAQLRLGPHALQRTICENSNRKLNAQRQLQHKRTVDSNNCKTGQLLCNVLESLSNRCTAASTRSRVLQRSINSTCNGAKTSVPHATARR